MINFFKELHEHYASISEKVSANFIKEPFTCNKQVHTTSLIESIQAINEALVGFFEFNTIINSTKVSESLLDVYIKVIPPSALEAEDMVLFITFVKCFKKSYLFHAKSLYILPEIYYITDIIESFFDELEVVCCKNYFTLQLKKHKEREYELQQSEEKLRTLINAMPDFVCFKDENGRWVEANNVLLNLLEIDPATYKGKTNMELSQNNPFYTEAFVKCELTDSMAWNTKSMVVNEESFWKEDGSELFYDVIKVPIFYDNGLRKGLVEIGRDITKKKKDDELKNKIEENTKLLNEAVAYDKLKTEFFSNISHEIRTPLNIILSTLQMLDLMKNSNSLFENGDKVDSYITSMKQNSLRLLKLVNNLIDITKIDSGYLDINLQPCDIVNLIEDTTLSTANYIKNKDIELLFDTEFEEKFILCDIDKIERIILNLLSNSVKFTNPGGKITVKLYEKPNSVVISVKDTGIGIPYDKQQVIFERFVQVDKSLSRSHEGSGIGLSIVKSLVEMHGGKIYVDSLRGKGSEFVVELPASVDEYSTALDDTIYKACVNKDSVSMEFSDIYIA